jgi:MHS family proline/betaine transporter-like MFS transporter
MAPILISIFLPNIDPLNALIITFLMYPIGIISRPIGAIIIGRIGDILGRKKALTIAIFGMAFSTGIIGLLPTYKEIGIAAPILFTICRIMQNFFVAGEYNGGAIYLLEHAKHANKGYISGLYCAYTVSGIIAAAAASMAVSYLPEGYWRLPYLVGFITGIFGFYIRIKALESPEFLTSKDSSKMNFQLLKDHTKKITYVIGIAGFFGALYTMPALLMTSFVPLVTDLTTKTVMGINTITLVIYMCMLPLSGMLADKIGFSRSMMIAAITTGLLTTPLIKLLSYGSIQNVFIAKAIFAVLSAWFIGPFHALAQSLFKVSHRYSLISLSYSIGSQIGGFMPGLSLWLWKYNNNITSIGFVLIIWALIGGLCCFLSKKNS